MTRARDGEARRAEVAKLLADAESLVANLKAGGASRGDFAAALERELGSGDSTAEAAPEISSTRGIDTQGERESPPAP